MNKKTPKQIKSFTVDHEAYDFLVQRLKESPKCDFTVSSLLNDYIRDLEFKLKGILAYMDEHKVPISRSWLIEEFLRSNRAYPPEEEDMLDPDMRQAHREEIDFISEGLIKTYEAMKQVKLARIKPDIAYGICGQCKYWLEDGEYCSLRKTIMRYVQSCNSFEVAEGVATEELVKVRLSDRMKVSDYGIVID